MTNKKTNVKKIDKAEAAKRSKGYYGDFTKESRIAYSAFLDGCEWKEQQMMELWNVARNVYEAWMGGTMNDVRMCMKDLGHVYDEFNDKGMEGGAE